MKTNIIYDAIKIPFSAASLKCFIFINHFQKHQSCIFVMDEQFLKCFIINPKKSKNNKIIFFIHRLQMFIKFYKEDKTIKWCISICCLRLHIENKHYIRRNKDSFLRGFSQMLYFYQPLSKTSILHISHARAIFKVFYNQSKKK